MDSLENRLNELLVKIYRSVEKLEETMLRSSKNLKLSISEIHMLEAIAHISKKNGATIGEIAEYHDIRMPSVTAAVNKLQQKGYVTKEKCGKDARVVRVTLTREGCRAEHAHQYFHRTMVRAVTAGLTAEEKEALLTGVGKLDSFLDKNIAKYNGAI